MSPTMTVSVTCHQSLEQPRDTSVGNSSSSADDGLVRPTRISFVREHVCPESCQSDSTRKGDTDLLASGDYLGTTRRIIIL